MPNQMLHNGDCNFLRDHWLWIIIKCSRKSRRHKHYIRNHHDLTDRYGMPVSYKSFKNPLHPWFLMGLLMSNEDGRRRFFVILCVLYEVVAPLFRQHIEKHFRSNGFLTFYDFLNYQKHSIFHMKYRKKCCKDKTNCPQNPQTPLQEYQYKQLYTVKSCACSPCHCNISANSIKLDDIDISLCCLLLNVCSISPNEKTAFDTLRKCRNSFSHNVDCQLNEQDYKQSWSDLERNILIIDRSKKDELNIIQSRPLDDGLCKRYHTFIIDHYERVEELNHKVELLITRQDQNMVMLSDDLMTKEDMVKLRNDLMTKEDMVKLRNDLMTKEDMVKLKKDLMNKEDIDVKKKPIKESVLKEIENPTIKDITHEQVTGFLNDNPNYLDGYVSKYVPGDKVCNWCLSKGITSAQLDLNSSKLGKKLFVLERQVVLKYIGIVDEPTGGVFMNDGRLVLVSFVEKKIVIFDSNYDSSSTSLLKGKPWHIVALDYKKVAITLHKDKEAETTVNSICIYDVDKAEEISSIFLTEGPCYCIAKLDERFLVTVDEFGLVFIDTKTCKIKPLRMSVSKHGILCATEDRIYLKDKNSKKKLLCCKISKNAKMCMKFSKRSFPDEPSKATMLPNGTMYITCTNGTLQHVAAEGKHKTVHEGLEDLVNPSIINFSSYRGLLYVAGGEGLVNIYRKLF
ncbi:unnamed protein product [Mytilus coruscus]|uniref:DZIP3-like HEPN domain-containing protein n=1 Tax=Mytilus coruscus TaxID=42192 RepID=A0A6J8A494_MYTCO|nr:unnamed protein product [Mytilus coruscus]